ncbi:MAG TPA: 50S ribosomal protein L21 [Candidatus Hydrogenedentes bacterium]|nr:50S ribosomal protein L21 [Candidatus Hydrogenedentota bacterium]
MYAVVKTGGKQYKVSPGDFVRVEKLEVPVGGTVELDEVCLVAKDDGVVVDPQALASVKVIAEVSGQGRRKKIRVFKYKRRKNYHRTYGHRQSYTELKIREIQA